MDLVPAWNLRKGTDKGQSHPRPLSCSSLAGLLSLAVSSQRWRPEQGLLSLGRGELKYLASYQGRTIYKGGGHMGLREEGLLWACGKSP